MQEQSISAAPVEYRDVPDFPGYRVGNDGSVWSCWKRIGAGKNKGSTFVIGADWIRLKASPDGDGYPKVTLCKERKHYDRKVHVLVLWIFVGPKPAGMVARHKDGVSTNCNVTNLEWSTQQKNIMDKKAHGTMIQGEDSHMAKLSETEVKEIRLSYSKGAATQEELGTKYGVSQVAIGCIVRRKSWKHVS
jgi:hypothetical protein